MERADEVPLAAIPSLQWLDAAEKTQLYDRPILF